MTDERDHARARAYLLGRDSDAEREALESEYFRSTETLEMVEAAEEALIEDYLANGMSADERGRFEEHYLASPDHRRRVETIRVLTSGHRFPRVSPPAAPAPAAAARRGLNLRVFAMAAGLVLVAGAGVWIAERSRQDDSGRAPMPSAPAPASALDTGRATRPLAVFTWSVSPVNVRGGADTPDTPALVIPSGTDVVNLRFEGEAGASPVGRGRVAIRTVAGDDVWQGAIGSSSDLPPGTVAAAQVPRDRLHADDYIVTLFERGSSGTESERARYFLRVRVR